MLNFSPWQFDPCVHVSSGRSMTSLYSDPEWSTNLDRAVSRLSGPGVEMEQALAWLNERSKEEHFSLTDVWGVLTSAGIMKQVPGPMLGNINSICYKIIAINMCYITAFSTESSLKWNHFVKKWGYFLKVNAVHSAILQHWISGLHMRTDNCSFTFSGNLLSSRREKEAVQMLQEFYFIFVATKGMEKDNIFWKKKKGSLEWQN